ncbi:MAG TPA: hotdog fold thioesterase [Taishania sp.]|nr:hotdog fold thioesterase [Taishania sp.]
MLDNDAFSNWMGVEVQNLEAGTCRLAMTVTSDMLNGFSITHGGISYSLADSALAFAANSRGFKCVSVETSISHVRPTKAGDTLIAIATEKHRGKTIGIYEVEVLNQEQKKVALFKGIVHVSTDLW